MSPRAMWTWGRTHTSTPRELYVPQDEAELQGILSRPHGRVRAFGGLHSWSDAALTNDVAISLDAMTGIVRADGTRVTVRGGTRIHALNAALHARGLAMPILGSIDQQSIAGAIATGTHGSSRLHGNLSSIVCGMRLVTAAGEIVDLSETDPRLDAARVHLGAMGVVSEVTLQTVPAFRLHETASSMPIDQAVDDLESISHSAEFVKVWWLPHTGRAVVFRADHTDHPSTFSPRLRWLDEHIVNRMAFRAVLAAGRKVPAIIPALNQLTGASYFRPQSRVGQSHEVFHLAMPPIHREMEYAVPMSLAQNALAEMVDWVRNARLRVNFVAEVRFVAADSGWISPAHGHDVCQIGAYMGQSADLAAYYEGFEERMLAHDGRPHWGKEFFAAPKAFIHRYPQLERWLDCARTLDPDGSFHNAFHERVFGERHNLHQK